MQLNDPNFPTSTTNPTLTDKALCVIGGLVKLMTFQQIKNLIGITVENVLNSNSAVNALSAAQGKVLNDALALKLNSSAYNEYNKGVYSSLIQLNTAHPTALAGSYALVDTGVGNEADFYWFDLDDGWVTNGGMSLANTDALVEGSSNLYFTNVRAISAAASVCVRYDQSQSLTDIQKNQFLTNLGLNENTNDNLSVQSNAQHMIFFDDFLNVEITKTYAATVSGVDEIPVSAISSATLNWIGGIRVFDSTDGGYFRANCPNKTSGSLFNFLEQNNTIDFTTEIYIPASAALPATSGNYFVGIVADHPSSVGLTGAVALIVWDVNNANWRLRLTNGNFIDTGVMASKGTKFKIEIRQSDDAVTVKINNNTVIDVTSNPINESAVLPCCGFTHAGIGTTYEIWQDYHGLKLTLQTSRTNFGFS